MNKEHKDTITLPDGLTWERLYIGVGIFSVLTIVLLYWFGRAFS